jgi:hypothetical protein
VILFPVSAEQRPGCEPADDVETADQANILLAFHPSLLRDFILYGTEGKAID